MEERVFSDSGEWTCPKCGKKSTGANCLQCKFCIYAGFWVRVLASTVDKGIIMATTSLFLLIRTYSLTGFSVVTVAGFLFYRFYHIGCIALWGQTPGKMAAKIKVVKVNGSPAGWLNAFLRNSVETLLITTVLVLELKAIAMVSPTAFDAANLTQKHELVEAFIPNTAKYVSWANQVFVLSEFVVLFLNNKKRAIHDFIAGTLVIHDPRMPLLPWTVSKEKRRFESPFISGSPEV